MSRALLIGGPYDGQRTDLRKTPKRISIGSPSSPRKHVYERVDDPATGDFMGGYVYDPPMVEVWDATGYTGPCVGSTEAIR